MKITPFTESDLTSGGSQFSAGRHHFTVENFMQKETGNGVPALELHLRLHNADADLSSTFTIRTTLYFSEKAKWRVAQFFKCVDRFDLIQSDELDVAKLIGLTGIAEFCDEKNENTGKKYLIVSEFLQKPQAQDDAKIYEKLTQPDIKEPITVPKTDKKNEFNDDIPF